MSAIIVIYVVHGLINSLEGI